MRVFSLFITLCLLSSASLWSQNFIGRYGDSSISPFFLAVTSQPDGTILAGGSGNFLPSPNQALLISLTPAGDAQWTRSYGDELAAWGVLDLLAAPDGNWIVLFSATNNPGLNGFGAYTIATKISSQDGSVIWARRLGTNTRRGYFSGLLAVEGGYVLAGAVEELNQEASYALARIDLDGALVWQNAWRQEPGLFSQFTDVIAGEDGRLWAVGRSVGPNNENLNQEVLARFSPEGELELVNTYEVVDGNRIYEGAGLTFQPGVGPVLGGSSFVPGTANTQPTVLQAGLDGEVIWTRTLNTPPGAYGGGGVLTAPDGGLLVGATGNELVDLTLLVRLDETGAVNWAHRLSADYGVEGLFDLDLDPQGNLLGAGQAFAPLPQIGRDAVVFKTDDLRFNAPSCCTDATPLDSRTVEAFASSVPLEEGLSFDLSDFDLSPLPSTLTFTPACDLDSPAIALSNSLICPGQCVQVLAPELPVDQVVQWIFPGGQPDTVVTAGPVEVCYEEEGDFEVLLVVDSCGRSARAIRVEQRLPPAFTLSDTLACPGECLEATISDPAVEDVYRWTFNGAEPDSALGVSPSPFCYPDGGQFEVALRIEGCGQRSQAIAITYIQPAFPNAFTPNGDDNNDTFSPIFPCEVEEYDLRIYNRWGREVFQSALPADSWDGSFQGDPAPSDVYIWTLTYTEVLNGEVTARQEQGEVILLR